MNIKDKIEEVAKLLLENTEWNEELQDNFIHCTSVNTVAEKIVELFNIPDVVQSFYCNQDDGEYNNNPCAEQCEFCKGIDEL